MTLSLAQKKVVVQDVAEVAKKSISVVASEYRGLTVEEMTDLRKQARHAGVYLKVVRNTLAKRAVEGTDFECMKEVLTGPLCLAFSLEEPSAAARLIRDYSKDHSNLQVKALSISGKLLSSKELDKVAKLPTYDEAVAKMLFVMKAPITNLARTLAAPTVKLVRTLAAVRDQKAKG